MLRVGGVRLPTTREFPWVCPEAILNRVLPEPVTKCWRILRGEKPETPVINNKSMLFVYGQRLPENVSSTFILNNRGFHSPCSQLQMKLGSFRNICSCWGISKTRSDPKNIYQYRSDRNLLRLY